MDLMQEIIANAQAHKQRIVLPEGDEPRTLKAADRLIADGVADVILIGPAQKIKEMASKMARPGSSIRWTTPTVKNMPTFFLRSAKPRA